MAPRGRVRPRFPHSAPRPRRLLRFQPPWWPFASPVVFPASSPPVRFPVRSAADGLPPCPAR
eukprot:8216495-Lingulodinium_polyedra.AAC.1